ncbi:MAG TPA: oligopeptide/dipeptide ABC transporter ATP-binding protein [Pseudonocardia sp.]|nr:oligopeptide/dipeptide ABC transporter ATP-binding protein [Pseudonocardia sp.]
MSEPLLVARDLAKHFPIRSGVLRRTTGAVKAVDGVDLEVHPGETLGLVGESGCGKSTTARLLLRLMQPTRGELVFDGQDLLAMPRRQLRHVRRDMQIVFQDPQASLNPRMSVGRIVAEPLRTHGYDGNLRARVLELLGLVGLRPEHAERYPHEFSGGQRQRIGIARAIALNPKLVVCDEAVSALDVSVQAQIINLLRDLQDELGLTYVFIAHDLAVVENLCDRVAVMYLGKVVESGTRAEIFGNPRHPYTVSLLSAVPLPDPERERERRRIVLGGEPPSPADPPPGCPFHPRCARAQDDCRAAMPPPEQVGPGHAAACFHPVPTAEKARA